VANVVGTDSRVSDFDRGFLPRRPDIGERWRRVEHAFPDGAFPPIVVYQLGDAYFVIDGHHRVAIARQLGLEMIDAEVTELQAQWHLPADADIVEIIRAEQERIFLEESGLGEARPGVTVRFGRPAGYIELLENVQIHGYHLMRAAGRVLPPAEIAADWYDTIYLPAVEAIGRGGPARAVPRRDRPGALPRRVPPPPRPLPRLRLPTAAGDGWPDELADEEAPLQAADLVALSN
jgi:hypothetical protein